MLPKLAESSSVPSKLKQVSKPSRTYALDLEKKRVSGYIDGLAAVQQAVYKILSTERYEHLIYSWNYGVEMNRLFGKQMPYVKSEIKRRIQEALTQDDRIQSVDAFSFTVSGRKLLVQFTVHSNLGTFQAEKEVKV